MVIEEVRGLIGEGWLRSDVAILYRSNAQSRVLGTRCSRPAALPVYGGLRFFERAEVKQRARLPAADGEPRRRHRVPAGRQLPGSRHRARTVEQLQDAARAAGARLYAAVAAMRGGAAAGKLGASSR